MELDAGVGGPFEDDLLAGGIGPRWIGVADDKARNAVTVPAFLQKINFSAN